MIIFTAAEEDDFAKTPSYIKGPFREPEHPNNVLACPDCGSTQLFHIPKSGRYFQNEIDADPEYKELFHKTYPDANIYEDPLIECMCHEDWRNRYMYGNGDWEDAEQVDGLFPLKHAKSINIHQASKSVPFKDYCSEPFPCHCGQCPDPNQLRFDLGGIEKTWWEK